MSEPRHFEKRWHAYWSGLKDPQYAQETEEHYRRYSVELRLLLDAGPRRSGSLRVMSGYVLDGAGVVRVA